MKCVKLKDIAELIMGQSPPSSTYNKASKGYRFLQGKADFGKVNPKARTYCSSPKKLSIKNDLLISVRAPVGDVNISDQEYCIGRGLAAIRCEDEKLYFKYLFYFLLKNKDKIISLGTGSTFKSINKSILSDIKIPLPPLPTQKKIVEVLDKAQSLIDARKEQIRLLDELTQSIFYDMFGDPVTNPKGWEIRKLSDVTNRITDGVHQKPNYTQDGIPFISVKNISNGTLVFDDCKYISINSHTKYTSRCKPERGDILYTKVGARYGVPAIVDNNIEFSIYVSVALLKPKKEYLNSVFLKEMMKTPYVFRQAIKSIKGIGVPDLHLKEIKNFNVIVPAMAVQDNYEIQVRRIHLLKEQVQKSLTECRNYYNCILKKAFSGDYLWLENEIF
ncbi:restriction endonuclease subunit S [Clostridium sp. 'deep sea']|uniref:restriction endonuclease subunit S n=1 Tax=Clostridium sp. 'deep sea' TaxID=2779445 RepID=UPI0018968C4C|nr:restriction endonuclease subunit S [Clostridium sp. 'deep sea']QOR36359.1 restriction endonuclease subunit S [Clostridium sp. 'deep sea']